VARPRGIFTRFPFCPLLEKAEPQTFLAEKELFSRIFRKTRVRQSIALLSVFVKAFQI
jgi:hypothetical protein